MILQHGLVFKNRCINTWFRFLNSCYRSRPCPIPTNPRKILLSNLGNIGDLLIASKAIASLKATYPDAEWGLLIAPHCHPSLPLLPPFKNIHLYDHWYQCKAALHPRKKIVREIQEQCYEMGIDLQPFYPNGVTLLRSANIPVRIGYSSGGFGASLTHRFDWNYFGNYLGDLHIHHLKQIGIPIVENHFTPKCFDTITLPKNYIVLHMCSSRTEKDWDRGLWIELIHKLKNWTLVLTGQGAKDGAECERVADATGCLNFCNRTTLTEYATLLQHAIALISVDSMGVHLAALLNIPRFILFSDSEHLPLWLPRGSHSSLMREDSIDKIVQFVHTQCHERTMH